MIVAMGAARLGRDAELPGTPPAGMPVTNLSLAFSYGKKGSDGKRPTTWVDATLWNKPSRKPWRPILLKGGQVAVVTWKTCTDGVVHQGRQDGVEMWKLVGQGHWT